MRLQITPSKKTFRQDGKWIESKPAEIIVCVCGNKYIKTRDLQTTCVRCLFKLPDKNISKPH